MKFLKDEIMRVLLESERPLTAREIKKKILIGYVKGKWISKELYLLRLDQKIYYDELFMTYAAYKIDRSLSSNLEKDYILS